ncbi:MAG: adenylosuccinate lyase, partial [Saprospiraceae bacterium]
MLSGLKKLDVNQSKIDDELNHHWIVLAEPIQTILRRESYPNPYEALKHLTRGQSSITKDVLHQFIDTLEINDSIKQELKSLTPQNYIGYANKKS